MIRSIFHTTIVLFLFTNSVFSQSVQTLNSEGKQSLRGLSVVNDKVVWVSGTQIGRSLNGGKKWEWLEVKGYKNIEFRDIEAFSKDVAIIMSVGEPAYILKTVDGGKTWKEVYKNDTKGMFLDAMDFSTPLEVTKSTPLEMTNMGYVVGDPIDGRFFIAKTSDGGEHWIEMYGIAGKADSTEACFASSGTNIRILKNGFVLITGGVYSNLVEYGAKQNILDLMLQESVNGKYEISKYKLPILQGTSSTGANSIAIKDSLNFIVVGGDFTNTEAGPNCVITNDGGKTWTFPTKSPEGYKSCVEYLFGDTWICCGLTGVDITTDNGKTWKQISKDSYHTCRKAKNGKKVYLSGNGSRIGVFTE